MLRWIISISLQFRYLVLAAASALVAFGISGLDDMPIDVFPEFAPPLVEIQTEGLGMSAQEVEELITIPMEESLRGTPKLDVIRSKSVDGLSSIQMLFKSDMDVLEARQLVQERLVLTAQDLPSFAVPTMLQPLSATSRVMKIGLKSETMSLMDMSMTAYWKMRFRLTQIPGVANVAIWGERIKALMIYADPERMEKHNISLNQLMETSADALEFGLLPYASSGKNRVEGFIETPNQRIEIRHVDPVMGPDDLAAVRFPNTNVTIGQVADVRWDHPAMIGDAVIDDGPGLMLIVEKFPWANTLEVTHAVEEAVEKMAQGLPELTIDTEIFRPATFIEMAIENLNTSLLLGCFLVMIVLFLFLYEWRVALISCTAIPLSLIAAIVVLYLRGTTINTMILAGFVIALGAVVDDAIVDIENIVRRLRQARRAGSEKSTASVILDASLEVRNAILYSTLIEVMALLPVFFMGGLSGSFFKPLAISYAMAICASTVVALTVTPALGLILLRRAPVEAYDSPVVSWIKHYYAKILAGILGAPKKAYGLAMVIVVGGALVVPQLGQELLPDFKERDFLMHWLTKPGSSWPENYRITEEISPRLRAIPGVRNFGAHIGRALVADEVVGMHFTENWVSVDPEAPYDETFKKIEDMVVSYPGIYSDVQTYLKERIREVLTGSGEAIVVRIFGPELDVLRDSAAKVEEALSGIDGMAHLHSELQVLVPQIVVRVRPEAALEYGLKPGDVRRASAAIMAGIEVTDIHRGTKVYDVMVWSDPETRNSVDSVRRLTLDTPDGRRVRLEEIADVTIEPTPNYIKREGMSRRIDVAGNVSGRDLGSVAREVEQRLGEVSLPMGYWAEVLGEYKERQESTRSMYSMALISVFGIFLLLQTSFGNWWLAFLSFLTLPAALVGGVIAVWMHSGVISLGSLVGFLTVLGIVARNGIMLINHYQHLEEVEGVPFGFDLVMQGSLERIAPILMTAITTGLALLPLILAGDIPGHEIELPTAVVILGGLVTSTTLNLFIIPAMYYRIRRR